MLEQADNLYFMRNKSIVFIFTISTMLSCGKNKNEPLSNEIIKGSITDTYKNEVVEDSCLYDFIRIRDLIYKSDTVNFKKYFKFPIQDQNIWYLVDSEGELDSNKPFTEKDFDKYFSKIFHKYFIKHLLKVKSKELFSKGKFSTNVISYREEENTINTKLDCVYNKKNKLTLTFLTEYYSGKDKLSESMCSYDFIVEKGHLIFKGLTLAG